ncbi:MAG: SUMF1/EgtB/PvdO family nonheme iron enzyme [Ardenticatenaceae bacterium]
MNGTPKRFGHYEVEKVLGHGGFGSVYLARDTKLGRQVVLKVLHPHLAADQVMVERFMGEARAMALLDHPNIVTIFSIENNDEQPYIVMEFISGVTLGAHVSQKVLSVREALPILQQIAAALDAAHAQGMVHRDIKPGNVLITHNGTIKLTDFGIVKMLKASEKAITPAMATVGTVLYMSPEQADINRQDEIGPASDLYALGIIAYQMLAGRVPFWSQNTDVILAAHRTAPLPDPKAFGANIPPAVVVVLQKALAKKPADRYPTAGGFITALKRAAYSEEPTRFVNATSSFAISEEELKNHIPPPPRAGQQQQQQQPKMKVPRWNFRPALIGVALLLATFLVGAFLVDVWPRRLEAFRGIVDSQATSVGVDNMVQVYVPAGKFLMGSTPDESDADHEEPQRTVYLDAFWIDQTEVTNTMYAECVAAGTCRPPEAAGWSSNESYYDNEEYKNYPVVGVSWEDANSYCSSVDRRLPTEAEWEKAARGTDGRKFPWGNETIVDNRVNYCEENCSFEWQDKSEDDGYAHTAPVGSYPEGESPYGALDMAGNVAEWVADWYDPTYYHTQPNRNPTGPNSGSLRTLRGGSWNNIQSHIRTAVRSHSAPSVRLNDFGFRCARTPD